MSIVVATPETSTPPQESQPAPPPQEPKGPSIAEKVASSRLGRGIMGLFGKGERPQEVMEEVAGGEIAEPTARPSAFGQWRETNGQLPPNPEPVPLPQFIQDLQAQQEAARNAPIEQQEAPWEAILKNPINAPPAPEPGQTTGENWNSILSSSPVELPDNEPPAGAINPFDKPPPGTDNIESASVADLEKAKASLEAKLKQAEESGSASEPLAEGSPAPEQLDDQTLLVRMQEAAGQQYYATWKNKWIASMVESHRRGGEALPAELLSDPLYHNAVMAVTREAGAMVLGDEESTREALRRYRNLKDRVTGENGQTQIKPPEAIKQDVEFHRLVAEKIVASRGIQGGLPPELVSDADFIRTLGGELQASTGAFNLELTQRQAFQKYHEQWAKKWTDGVVGQHMTLQIPLDALSQAPGLTEDPIFKRLLAEETHKATLEGTQSQFGRVLRETLLRYRREKDAPLFPPKTEPQKPARRSSAPRERRTAIPKNGKKTGGEIAQVAGAPEAVVAEAQAAPQPVVENDTAAEPVGAPVDTISSEVVAPSSEQLTPEEQIQRLSQQVEQLVKSNEELKMQLQQVVETVLPTVNQLAEEALASTEDPKKKEKLSLAVKALIALMVTFGILQEGAKKVAA